MTRIDVYTLPADVGTFEYDDYPEGGARLIEVLDRFRERWPDFRATVFAVPMLMTDAAWRPLLDRADWVRVAPHGFIHRKRECRLPEHYRRRIDVLDTIAVDPSWTKIQKPPYYGYDAGFVELLRERGFAVCQLSLGGWAFPAADVRVWNLEDHRSQAYPLFRHILAHPIYEDDRSRPRTVRSALSEKNVHRWFHELQATGVRRWEFVDELTRPSPLKLHLGCGTHVLPGWANLDPRAQLDPRIVRWEYPNRLPFDDNRADCCLTSHLFNYVAEDQYARFALDVWRVLRPGAIWRLSEDRTDNGYIWRRPGQRAAGTGTIRSLPTQEKIYAALRAVGFVVRPAEPGRTDCPHVDILAGDSRAKRYARGHKFYAEAVKAIYLEDIARSRWHDPRADRRNVYHLPGD